MRRMSETFRDRLRVLHGGEGSRTVLLLHGIGATADVWRGLGELLDAQPDRPRWLAPDLPGHGGSAALARYSTGSIAAAVAPLLDSTDDVTILGHSLGGMLGLTLATGWFGVAVREVVGVGIKVAWSPEERTRMASLATKPPRRFASRAEALAWHAKVSGLAGLTPPEDPRLSPGVDGAGDDWGLAMDPRAYELEPAEMPALLAAVAGGTSVVLARGEHDAMVSDDDLLHLTSHPVTLPGLGHNAHVEDPAAVLALVGRGDR
jgi:pimeloyl-ACP methyl ester carboxylesterase